MVESEQVLNTERRDDVESSRQPCGTPTAKSRREPKEYPKRGKKEEQVGQQRRLRDADPVKERRRPKEERQVLQKESLLRSTGGPKRRDPARKGNVLERERNRFI